jgi:superfamily II DNA or RNA helicase
MICEPHVLFEISPHFEFYADKFQYHPLYKKQKWDGIVRLISTTTGRFYTGLLKRVILKLKELGYNEFSFEGFSGFSPEYSEDDVLRSIETFNLPVDRQVREYQLNAILSCLMGFRRIILSPTSSGKSLIIYIISRILLDSDEKILIIVPTTMLVDQLFTDFEDYAIGDEFNIDENYHRIFAGQDKISSKGVYISTWQSINAIPKKDIAKYMSKFTAVMVDEVHGAEASCLKTILEHAVNAKWRFGFTGTIKDSITHELTLIGLFGTVKRMISIKELMDLGYIAKLKITCVILKYSEEMCKLVSTMDYDQELDTVIGYDKRNKFLANLADKIQGNTLIIVRFIEKHANKLLELLDDKNNKKTFLLSGDVDRDKKMMIKEHMETVTNTNLMGTWGMVSTGMSIINLDNGIYASPSKSEIRVPQSIGRLLRKGINKHKAHQYDIVDDLRYEGRPNFLMTHFRKRYEYYKAEGFEVEIVEVKIG